MLSTSRIILESLPVGTFMLDVSGKVVAWNKACELLTGIESKQLIGSDNHWQAFYTEKRPLLADLVQQKSEVHDLNQYYGEKIWESKTFPGGFEGEGFFPKISEGKWLRFSASAIKDENNQVIGSIETILDITEEKLALEELRQSKERYKALYLVDSMTRFNNAMGFELRIQSEMERMKVGDTLGILAVELDSLKLVNEKFGRVYGDQLIKTVSRCIKMNIDVSDVGYRSNGGRFYVVISNPAPSFLDNLATSILSLTEQYPVFTASGHSIECAIRSVVINLGYGVKKADVWEEIEKSFAT